MSTTTPAAGSFQPSLNHPSLIGKGAVSIRPKSKTVLAKEYEVHRTTMGKMCREAGVKSAKKLTINELLAIYNKYGYPGDYDVALSVGPTGQA
jgi:hypothetical protein